MQHIIYLLRSSNYHRVIGDFHCGVNAPSNYDAIRAEGSKVYLGAEQTHQIKLKVNTKKQQVVMQVVISMPGKPIL